ncbi:uncharacterized protein LOC135957365 isoform X2 [Calliphora vicina]|uniref:uncharacterized protein LOC135957365 isoform X2 n=1 Tax=Calliphora vicina TaxID=7373 RepID=UPI00325AF91F
MNSKQIMFGVALIAFCCVSLSTSLKCYVCDSRVSCKKPELLECNQKLASDTLTYLQKFHTGIDTSVTSNTYKCLLENTDTTTSKNYYRGCIYPNVLDCNLPSLSTEGDLKMHECRQCNDRDGCNPAGRAHIGLMTVIATIVLGFVTRSVWH